MARFTGPSSFLFGSLLQVSELYVLRSLQSGSDLMLTVILRDRAHKIKLNNSLYYPHNMRLYFLLLFDSLYMWDNKY